MKALILNETQVATLRPAVVEYLRNRGYSCDVEATGEDPYGYDMVAIAEGFTITPRDIGFDFDDWTAYRAAFERTRYPRWGNRVDTIEAGDDD